MKPIASKVIDSSIWISYLTKEEHKEEVEGEDIKYTPTLVIFEIKKKLLKDNIPIQEIETRIQFIKKVSIIISLTSEIAEQAAKFSIEKGLGTADAIIYTTAQQKKAILLTEDNDFRRLSGVKVVS